MALLFTSVIRVSRPHLELYSLNNRKGWNALTLFTHKKGEKQICSTETKEQACLNETEGLELVRLLQVHCLTYLTKLTPRRDDFIFYLGRKVIRWGPPPSRCRLARHRYRRARSLGSSSPDRCSRNENGRSRTISERQSEERSLPYHVPSP